MSEKATRLFIGVDVSIECANQLRATAAALRDELAGTRLTWVEPARYHITLKYLGWTDPTAVYAIRDRVAGLLEGARELRFTVDGLGAFPEPAAARVLWAGIQDPEPLATLAAVLDEGLEDLGFPRESGPFHPHVTLARAREVANLKEVIVGSEHRYSKTVCRFVNLYESDMNSKGSGYPSRSSWELRSSKRQRSDLEQRDN